MIGRMIAWIKARKSMGSGRRYQINLNVTNLAQETDAIVQYLKHWQDDDDAAAADGALTHQPDDKGDSNDLKWSPWLKQMKVSESKSSSTRAIIILIKCLFKNQQWLHYNCNTWIKFDEMWFNYEERWCVGLARKKMQGGRDTWYRRCDMIEKVDQQEWERGRERERMR